MPSNIYEVLAMGARYWFALLGVLIVLRSFLLLRKDRKAVNRRLRELPDAGYVGDLELLEAAGDFMPGTLFPVLWEGTLGYSRTCDIVIPVSNISSTHLDFSFAKKTGLIVTPRRHRTVVIDGELIRSAADAKAHPLGHNSILVIGDAVLRFRAFMGLELEHSAAYADTGYTDQSETRAAVQATVPAVSSEPYTAPEAHHTAVPYNQQIYSYAPDDGNEYQQYDASIPVFKQGYGESYDWQQNATVSSHESNGFTSSPQLTDAKDSETVPADSVPARRRRRSRYVDP